MANDNDTLYIFDFDDTLVRSNEMIHVTHSDGSVSSFTTHEYAMYEPREGDESDFGEFEQHLSDPDVLPHYDAFLDAIDAVGVENVVILTARTYESPPKRWLHSMGVAGVAVHALNSTSSSTKAAWIRKAIIDRGYDRVVFFDDNELNVRAVDALKGQFPSTEIVTVWVN